MVSSALQLISTIIIINASWITLAYTVFCTIAPLTVIMSQIADNIKARTVIMFPASCNAYVLITDWFFIVKAVSINTALRV